MSNNKTDVLLFSDMPFCIGACQAPHNPSGLPDTYPLKLFLDNDLGMLRLQQSGSLSDLLERGYGLGVEMGTPLSDTALGQGYVGDFVGVINKEKSTPGRALEIGAGVGYVSFCLKELGWDIDSLEPGDGYEQHWQRYGIDVIKDFFPSDQAQGPYDIIVAYAVLEHMPNPVTFLRAVAQHLSKDGVLILAVPDCTDEIHEGDPGMLIHEHFLYFTETSLGRCLGTSGLQADIFKAGYGRLLYAVARPGIHQSQCIDHKERDVLASYISNCRALSEQIINKANTALSRGELGIYCPSRALAVLPQNKSIRFFDDAPELQGKYYPPFSCPIESREELFSNPPDELWVMSRTFGDRLLCDISGYLPDTKIVLIDDLLD
ncbi:MAG: class I SAM-dependent methyltransferase [Halioglobus sp.]